MLSLGVFLAPATANVVFAITRVRGALDATVDAFAMGLLASAGTLLYFWLAPIVTGKGGRSG